MTCWAPFLGCPFWFLEECGSCVLPGGNCFWDLSYVWLMGFTSTNHFNVWELTLSEENELEGMYLRVSARGRRAGCATRICLVTGEWEQRGRRSHSQVVSYRPADDTRGLDWRKGGKVKIWRSPTCLSGQSASLSGIASCVCRDCLWEWSPRQRDGG